MAKLTQLMFSIIIKSIHTNALITIYYSRFILIAHSALHNEVINFKQFSRIISVFKYYFKKERKI